MTSRFQLLHHPKLAAKAKARVEAGKSAAPVGHGPPGKPKAAPRAIGLWNLGGWFDTLPKLIAGLNRAQARFIFYHVDAMVPSGLISRRERTIAWAAERLGRKLTASERSEVGDNIVSEDFFPLGDSVRKTFGLDYIVGITPFRVADETEDDVVWNYFSTFKGRVVLVSTADLREFASDSGASFEAFAAMLIVAELYVAMFHASHGLGFHLDDEHKEGGCLFEDERERVTIKDSIRQIRVDEACLNKVPAPYQQALKDFVRYIQRTSGLSK